MQSGSDARALALAPGSRAGVGGGIAAQVEGTVEREDTVEREGIAVVDTLEDEDAAVDRLEAGR